jgi:hypothetical protein
MTYIEQQWKDGKFLECARFLLNKVTLDGCDKESAEVFQKLDDKITATMLHREQNCSKTKNSRDPWSPSLALYGRTLTFWKRKLSMAKINIFDGPFSNNTHLQGYPSKIT